MRNRRKLWITISILFVVLGISLLTFLLWPTHSYTSWHKLTNGTEDALFVTLFEGFPVNRVYSDSLEPGGTFEIKDEMERPGYFFVISAGKHSDDKYVVYRKMMSWNEYGDAQKSDNIDGFHITPERLATWDH
jgi:hypothetical protein